MSKHGEISAATALDFLNLALRHLLEAVEADTDNSEVLQAAWDKCQVALERFDQIFAAIEAPSQEERDEINEGVQTAVRLNAIATHLVQREAERVGNQLEAVSDAKRKLRTQVSRSSDTGGSVDLAG